MTVPSVSASSQPLSRLDFLYSRNKWHFNSIVFLLREHAAATFIPKLGSSFEFVRATSFSAQDLRRSPAHSFEDNHELAEMEVRRRLLRSCSVRTDNFLHGIEVQLGFGKCSFFKTRFKSFTDLKSSHHRKSCRYVNSLSMLATIVRVPQLT